MNKIITLDKNLANQIAAWEVVERPVSVIKEIVENSIDAHATNISIEIENWWIDKMVIIDNGTGIQKDDMTLVTEKYSTSKIKSLDDLYNVMTFGFRWEAMASVASVSNMTIESKIDSNLEWYSQEIIGWEKQEIKKASMQNGTKIIIEDLFYNTPARLNYLKKPRTEHAHINTLLQQIALTYPQIGIRFTSDGKEIFHYRQDEDIQTRIYSIYGDHFSSNILKVEHVSAWMTITWYISDPKINFPTRTKQSLFINKRVVKSPLVYKAIETAYNRFIPHGCHSAYVVFLDIDPTLIDVNVHPRKLEVRFAQEKEIFRNVYHCIQDKLDKVSLIDTNRPQENKSEESMIPQNKEYYTGSWTKFKSYSPYSNKTSNPNQGTIHQAMGFNKAINENTFTTENINKDYEYSWDLHQTPLWKIIGQSHNSYIIVENNDGIIFYDQHALAERILYEKLIREDYNSLKQWLLIGESIIVNSQEKDIIQSNAQVFLDMWFDFEILPGNSILLSSIPDFIKKESIKDIFLGIIQDIWEYGFGKSKTLEEVKNKIFAYTSCRSAIKFGHKLSVFEMNKLLHDAVTDYSATCPHGRPVVFNISLNDLKDKYER